MKRGAAALAVTLLLNACHRQRPLPLMMAPSFSCVVMNENAQDMAVEISYNLDAPRWVPLVIPAHNEQTFERPVRIRILSPSVTDDHDLAMGKRYAIIWQESAWRVVEPTPR
jgi:hypothetical protein